MLGDPVDSHAAKNIPVDQALPIIEALQNRIRVAQWTAEGIDGRIRDFNDLDSIENPQRDGNHYAKWKVTFEPQSGRYRVDYEYVSGWSGGSAPHIAGVMSYSMDGLTERKYHRSLPGMKVPSPKEGYQDAQVVHPRANAFINDRGFQTGMGYFPPYFANRRLSEFLRERVKQKKPLTIEEDERGQWQIETTPPEAIFEAASRFRINYDPGRGIVLDAEWIGKPDAPNLDAAGKVWQREVLKWTKADGNLWVPQAFYRVNLLDRGASRINYRDMRVNPKLDDLVFRVNFPPGTKVMDEVAKKIYQVGTGVVDEQAAIKEFMEWEKLRDSQASAGRGYLLWTILGGGLVLIVAVFVFFRRKRKAAIKVVALLLVAWLASKATAYDLDADGNWTVSHGKGETVRISQCGLNVAVFALEYFHVDYRVKPVAAGLPPTEEGIRFSDIKAMIEGHGLDVVAREKVTLQEMKRALRPGTLAIFPVRVNSRENHYLIALHHASRGRLLIDPPVKVHALDERLQETHLSELGGVVLFVRRPAAAKGQQSSRIEITPAFTDLGKFSDVDPIRSKYLDKQVKITNTSDKAVLVTDVLTGCGCLRSGWEGGILPPGETREVKAKILLGGWGPGRTERSLTMLLGDGSEARIRFLAEILPSDRPKLVQAFPDVVRIELTKEVSDVKRTIYVKGDKAKLKKLVVSSHPAWLRTELHPRDDEEMRLVVFLAAKELPVEASVTGEVCLVSDPSEPSINVHVVVNRPERYRPEPAVIRFTEGSNEEQAVLLTAIQSTVPPPAGLTVLSAPKGLKILRSDRANGAIELRLSLGGPLSAGSYLVSCRLGADGLQEPPIRLVIQVVHPEKQ